MRAPRSTSHGVPADRVRLHIVPTDRVWLRDSAPIGVHDARRRRRLLVVGVQRLGEVRQLAPRRADCRVQSPRLTGHRLEEPRRDDTGERIVLEGGGLDVNGQGLMLVTEEWLLSDTQVRNPGLTRADYEEIFRKWLGVRHTLWLGDGCVGDDTHGHVDDIARFVTADTIVLAVEEDPRDENHERSIDNLRRLELAAGTPGVGPLRDRDRPVPASGHDERRATAGELRELLHRQRRRAGADFQRRQRPDRARDARSRDAGAHGRRHPRGRSGVGARHAALPDAAGAATARSPALSEDVVIEPIPDGVVINVRVIPRARLVGPRRHAR